MRNSHGDSRGGRAARLGILASIFAAVAMVLGFALGGVPASARSMSLPSAQGTPVVQRGSA
ncbi:hypothetical protein, partial [Actinotignum sanguinis]